VENHEANTKQPKGPKITKIEHPRTEVGFNNKLKRASQAPKPSQLNIRVIKTQQTNKKEKVNTTKFLIAIDLIKFILPSSAFGELHPLQDK
jgi:hypothetical protein